MILFILSSTRFLVEKTVLVFYNSYINDTT